MSCSSPDDLKFSREQGFFDKSRILRWFIVFLLFCALFFFLHFREVQVDILELGSISPKYVVAEVDFSFPDEEATAMLKQEALLDISRIYAIDPDDVQRRRVDFENTLIQNEEWRQKVKETTFDEVYRAVEILQRTLFQARFTDFRTLEKMKELKLATVDYYELAIFDPTKELYFTEKIWKEIRENAFRDHLFQQGTIDFVLDYMRDKIWKLREDGQMQRKLRKTIQSNIVDKYTFVPAGSRIIDHGEKVFPRHIAMLQAMKRALDEQRNLMHLPKFIGSCLLVLTIIAIGACYLRMFHPSLLQSNRKLFLLVTILIFGILFSKVTEFILLRTNDQLFEIVRYPLILPFCAIILSSLINQSVAIFCCALLAGVINVALVFEKQGFLLTNLVVAFFAILYAQSMRKRTDIFIVSMKSWSAGVVMITAFHLYSGECFGISFAADILSSGLSMLTTTILVAGLLPVFESSFCILTDIALMEYMDPNHPIMKRLVLEAPGTYQHSLIMGHIAESAARAVGANGLFCRVASLYHDIGKIPIAQYFTENQQYGVNIHQLLTPVESAQVIISHVSEGVSLARKEGGLPEQFIDIIKEHHGTSLVYFFYHKMLESAQGDRSKFNESDFRYFGPKPNTKESVIIMIADSFEAASRSLDEITEEALTDLMNQLVKEKLEDGQLDVSLLTFEELGKVKRAMVSSMLTIGHFRVKYPSRVRIPKGSE